MAVLALFPGSFDPFTAGHEAILRRVLPLFDKVVLHLPGHDVKLIRKCPPASARAIAVDGVRLPGFSITHGQLTAARKIVWLP